MPHTTDPTQASDCLALTCPLHLILQVHVYVGLDTQTGIENSKINFPTYSLSRQEIFDRLIDPVGTISAHLKFMQIGLHVDVDRQVGLHSMLSSVALA